MTKSKSGHNPQRTSGSDIRYNASAQLFRRKPSQNSSWSWTLLLILTVAKATDKLAHWQLTMSEFQFGIVHRADNGLSNVISKAEHGTQVGDKAPVLSEYVRLLVYKLFTLKPGLATREKNKAHFPFHSIVCSSEGITDQENRNVPTLTTIIITQSTDSDFRTAFRSVGKTNNRFSVSSDVALVRVSHLHVASQQITRIVLLTRFPNLCYYSSPAGNPSERRLCNSMKNELHRPDIFNDVHVMICGCGSYAQKHVHEKTQRQFKLFSRKGLRIRQ